LSKALNLKTIYIEPQIDEAPIPALRSKKAPEPVCRKEPVGILVLAAQSQPVYTPPPPDGAMQLLKVARDRTGVPSSSQPDNTVRFSSVLVDASPC